MKTLAIVLVSLCVIAQATSVFQAPAFLQIKQSPFGNAVASMVQMNLETENPSGKLNAINDLLNQVEESLNEQGQAAKEDIEAKRDYCSSSISDLQNEIGKIKNELNGDKEEQQTLLDEQSSKSTELANEKNALERNSAELVKTQEQIEEENASYSARNAEYEEAITACHEALTLLSHLQTSSVTNFAQVKSKFNSVVTLLQKHVAKRTSSLIQPIINVLTELSTSAQEVDQAKLGKIINLINQLLEELQSQQVTATANHIKSIEDLTALIARLEQSIAQNHDQIQILSNKLDFIRDRLEYLAWVIDYLTNYIAGLEDDLEKLQQKCNDYETVYEAETAEREQQQNLLDQLQDYFEKHVVPSVEHVRDESYEDVLTN